MPSTERVQMASPRRGAAPFRFHCPLVAFEKADAAEGQRKRIGGIISTDSLDQQNERILQDGLDFSRFLDKGWYNDNHKNDSVTDPVGYPESVKTFAKGETLPNGKKAKANGTWTEGYLVGEKGDKIWRLARDLEGTGRSLGFSVEGDIQKRTGKDNSIIARAAVHHVAVTHVPVNLDSELEVLARSLTAVRDAPDRKASPQTRKALTVGTGDPALQDQLVPNPIPNVPVTGEGAMALLVPGFGADAPRRKRRRKKGRKSLTTREALEWVRKAVPGISAPLAREFIQTTRRLQGRGII